METSQKKPLFQEAKKKKKNLFNIFLQAHMESFPSAVPEGCKKEKEKIEASKVYYS